MFDVLAIAATCDRPLGAVLKKELKDVPFLKQIIACTKSFAMDREDVRQSLTVIQSVIKEINSGRSYLIFPEGTRSKSSNDLLEFHNGSFRCAAKTGCPVIPVALVDCYKVLDQKGSKPVTVQIHYLEPIYHEEYKDLNTKELAALVRGRIETKVKESI
jgi:1-acyl-sn-glycerol-3-phosphate acyltransferase